MLTITPRPIQVVFSYSVYTSSKKLDCDWYGDCMWKRWSWYESDQSTTQKCTAIQAGVGMMQHSQECTRQCYDINMLVRSGAIWVMLVLFIWSKPWLAYCWSFLCYTFFNWRWNIICTQLFMPFKYFFHLSRALFYRQNIYNTTSSN